MTDRRSGDKKGIVTKESPHNSVSETLEHLRRTVREKGLQEFALIDHGGAAERAGLTMQEAKLLIFGSPKAGTPLMVASPLLALDPPLKVLIQCDGDGEVPVSHNAAPYLASRRNIPRDLLRYIAGIDALVQSALGEA
jgi:uncharacterized protein (DUF302 family)